MQMTECGTFLNQARKMGMRFYTSRDLKGFHGKQEVYVIFTSAPCTQLYPGNLSDLSINVLPFSEVTAVGLG